MKKYFTNSLEGEQLRTLINKIVLTFGTLCIVSAGILGVNAYNDKVRQYTRELQEIEMDTIPLKTEKQDLEIQIRELNIKIEAKKTEWKAKRCLLAIEEGNQEEYCFQKE